MHLNWAVSKGSLGKFENYWSGISISNPTDYCIPRRHRLLGQSTKHPLSNFEPLKPWKYKQLSGQRLDAKFLSKIKNICGNVYFFRYRLSCIKVSLACLMGSRDQIEITSEIYCSVIV